MGRAKDVVKIALRSDPSRDSNQHPEVIYAILKQHFSDISYSCMPLAADFYSTLPEHKESAFDYWVRLNKAADVADESLRRQGKRMEDVNKEVAMMFVRHCPDQSLAMVFKSKLVEQWTAKEVQERIDEYQCEMKTKRTEVSSLPRQNAALMLNSEESHSEYSLDCALQSCKQTIEQPRRLYESVPTSQSSVDRMTDMLSKVLESVNALRATNSFSAPQHTRRGRDRCRICSEGSHSTLQHCRTHCLCFACHQPGHLSLCYPAASHQCAVTAPPVKIDSLHSERGSVGISNASLKHTVDLKVKFESIKQSLPSTATVIMQNTSHLLTSDSLFHTPVVINESITVRAMLDTGSMACTISENIERK
ncbi:uncharacterized protein LOC122128886 [Clupea harengus]|uniref:Uncharacterized protein LOC122128886 n=1 Tax=Clupea harengus TaxID=7950 RepID=A0A8M1KD67_CLUHA|nr:uncharacterized protein LOC122128886 [Clupea harengus]